MKATVSQGETGATLFMSHSTHPTPCLYKGHARRKHAHTFTSPFHSSSITNLVKMTTSPQKTKSTQSLLSSNMIASVVSAFCYLILVFRSLSWLCIVNIRSGIPDFIVHLGEEKGSTFALQASRDFRVTNFQFARSNVLCG
jgi:hypothetical protein